MSMEKNNIHRHCPEVENLMRGKIPFVTRYGITLVVLVFLVISIGLLLSEGPSQQLLKEMLGHITEQIKSKI